MVKRISLAGLLLVVLIMAVTGLWTSMAQEDNGYNELTASAIYAATYAAMPACELSSTGVAISAGPCTVPDWYGQEATPDATAAPDNNPFDGWADGWLYRLTSGGG